MNKQSKRSYLLSTTSLILLGMAASTGGALAQNNEGEEDLIVVKGIKKSLADAQNMKRNARGVLDAVTAEDIGKFPDTNLAESLQRITGVSINRVNGEGSEVTVRGFGPDFNLITLNGRVMPTANVKVVGSRTDGDFVPATSRSFDFSNLASEGVRALEVYKTSSADQQSGGLGATVNVVTRKPFDSGPGLQGTIGAKAVHDRSVELGSNITPEVSGFASWSDEDQKIGVALFGSFQQRDSGSVGVSPAGWNIVTPAEAGAIFQNAVIEGLPTDPNALVAIPNDARYFASDLERERINGQATVQFRPTERLTLSVDATYYQNKAEEQLGQLTNWINRNNSTQAIFEEQNNIWTSVFVREEFTGGKDTQSEQLYRATKDTLKSFGFNAELEASDWLTISLDAHTSEAKSDPDNPRGETTTAVAFGTGDVAFQEIDYRVGPIPRSPWGVQPDNIAAARANVLAG